MTDKPNPNPFLEAAKAAGRALVDNAVLGSGAGNGESVPISPQSLLQQLERAVRSDQDPDEAIRLALSLAALMASQTGWTYQDALKQAFISWQQFAPLRR